MCNRHFTLNWITVKLMIHESIEFEASKRCFYDYEIRNSLIDFVCVCFYDYEIRNSLIDAQVNNGRPCHLHIRIIYLTLYLYSCPYIKFTFATKLQCQYYIKTVHWSVAYIYIYSLSVELMLLDRITPVYQYWYLALFCKKNQT